MIKELLHTWQFLTRDIWRVTEGEVTKRKFSFYTIVKTLYLTITRCQKDNIFNMASSLTYSTLLAVVPILAILFAIARGFGFRRLMRSQVAEAMGFMGDKVDDLMALVDSYLRQAGSGVFIGIGLAMLLWTVLNLTSQIEANFNTIWQVNKPRSMYRKITDYFSMFLLLPIVIVTSGSISIFVGTQLKSIEGFFLLGPFIQFLIKLVPYVFTSLMLTGLFIFMPNTKVKFKNALIAGIFAGFIFQVFQYLYITGQIWVSKYNAIYGSFAAIPLFLLWVQMSWTICLLGVELAYASQNIHTYTFDHDTRNISRRYRDFLTVLIASLICKRFVSGEEPYSAESISEEHRIPITLTNQILYHLQQLKLVHEVLSDAKSEESTYQPSIDVNQFTVALLLERIEMHGSEDFKINHDQTFIDEWQALSSLKNELYTKASNYLLKDL